jgi:hypothetical protein
MGKSSDKSLVVSVLLVCAVVAVGVAAYVKLAPADTVPVVVDTEVRPEGGGVKLLTPYYDDDGVLKYKTEEVNVPRDTDPHVYAVNKYLDLVSVVPEGAVLKSVKVENTIAVLDFSAEFATSYSTFDESTIVNGSRRSETSTSLIRWRSSGLLLLLRADLEIRPPRLDGDERDERADPPAEQDLVRVVDPHVHP